MIFNQDCDCCIICENCLRIYSCKNRIGSDKTGFLRSNLGRWLHATLEFRSEGELRGGLNSEMGGTALTIDLVIRIHTTKLVSWIST